MIIFDTNKNIIQQLKRIIPTKVKAISTLEDGILLLKSDIWIHTLMIGVPSEDLVNWIIAVQPPIRNIIVYCEWSDTLKILIDKLRNAHYNTNHIPLDTIKERLSK